jgi:methionyl-tRNA synthetase
MKNKFYITTPIYYVNDKPHVGHAYTTVLADVLARWHKLCGEDVFFSAGTDEHGAKIETAAMAAGVSPQKFVDEKAADFKNAWQVLDISYDNFIRTTDAGHEKAVSNVLEFLHKKGLIYQDVYKGLYCKGCEQYKSEDDLIDGKCPDHQIEPELMEEMSYFLKLSKFGDEIAGKIESGELKIEPAEKKNEILKFLEKGLNDISISRANVKWGILLPFPTQGGSVSGGDKKYTVYVWIDAFLNYLTGLGWQGKIPLNPSLQKGGAGNAINFFPPDIQLMSKDILRVHATIWPALLLALEMPLPEKIFVHGFFTIDGQKMSKSLGNVIWPEQLVEKFGVDGARYLLMSSLAYGHDGDISWDKLAEKYNADLANGLGNLINRTMTLAQKVVFKHTGEKNKGISERIKKLYEEIKPKEILEEIWKEINWANKYIEEKRLWELVKNNEAEAKKVLEELFTTIYDVAENLKPFMPETAEKILKILDSAEIKKGEILFPRV